MTLRPIDEFDLYMLSSIFQITGFWTGEGQFAVVLSDGQKVFGELGKSCAAQFLKTVDWWQDAVNETIAVAAIRQDGKVYSVPRPGRHHDVIRLIAEETGEVVDGDQGFVTSTGRFVDRWKGFQIAKTAHQLNAAELKRRKAREFDQLYSEDIW